MYASNLFFIVLQEHKVCIPIMLLNPARTFGTVVLLKETGSTGSTLGGMEIL